MMRWEVLPLELGRRTAHEAWFFFLSESVDSIEIAYRAWLLRSGSSFVLVDTGPPIDEAARRGLRDVVAIDRALHEVGVEPSAIRQVILTHMHWDHAAGCDRLPAARYLVQRTEADFFTRAAHEHPATARFFSHREKLQSLLDSGRCEFVDGDAPCQPGIDLIRVGGHTPGSQMVLVETAQGKALITGDVLPFARNYEANVPNGILVNLMDSIAALSRIRQMKPAIIYPGHDVVPFLRTCSAGEVSG